MAVWQHKKENDKEHLFIVKNYSPPVLFVSLLLDRFLSLISPDRLPVSHPLLPLLDFQFYFVLMHQENPSVGRKSFSIVQKKEGKLVLIYHQAAFN